jgi:hypothetical protein
MPVFTFPSGATVEAPEGLPLCERPDAVTYDIGRSIPVGVTRSGKPVFSGFSCAAYAALGGLYNMHQEVAKDRKSADRLEARGKTWQAGNLRRNADNREARNAQIIDRVIADSAPCSCVIPPVRAGDLAAELGVPADEIRDWLRRYEADAKHRGGMDEAVTFRCGPDGELEVMHAKVISLRMHYAQKTPTG